MYFPLFSRFPQHKILCLCEELLSQMYPKGKVRRQIGEDDEFGYEKSSFKAFEWLSLDPLSSSSSSDVSPRSVVRTPRSYVSKSPTPSFQASKEGSSKKMGTVMGQTRKNVRSISAPRPRAVLSSPDNDCINWNKTKTRRDLLEALKNHNSCRDRHTQCKISPASGVCKNESTNCRNDIRARRKAAGDDLEKRNKLNQSESQVLSDQPTD